MSNSIAESLIADMKQEGKYSRAILGAVPADKYDWQPHEKSMSLGMLASHIAETPTWLGSMMEDVFDFGAGMKDYKPFAAADQEELLAAFDENLAGAIALLEDKDDEFMTRVWKGVKGDKELMAGPRGAVARSILVQHAAHHRGQLTVYLRMLDVPVPPTYGPTADFPSEDWS
ncbi:MAG: hypothetical protein GY769_12235 [bacterium]|nr:hypothetical protein [bacterium]